MACPGLTASSSQAEPAGGERNTAAAPIDPVQGGFAAILLSLVGLFVRMMFKYQREDRGAGFDLASEREKDNARLRAENEKLHEELGDQRTLKHAALNRLTISEGTLDLVRGLYDQCSCGALSPLGKLLDRRSEPHREGDTHG